MFDLEEVKIKDFVLDFMNYSNIKSVYFAHKISEILGGIIPLNCDLTYELIENIYSEEIKEYYMTPDKIKLDQEILLWVVDMIVNDLGNSVTYLNIDHLESLKFLTTGNNITFTITSKYSGTLWFWIDGVLLESDTFTRDGQTFFYSLDAYAD